MKLQGATHPAADDARPAVDMLGELEVKCTQVAVTELRDNTFFASITLQRQRPRAGDRLAPVRRARPRRPLRRPDLRRRGGHRRVGDRVRARGRGHRGGRRAVQGLPRPGHAGGLRRRRARCLGFAQARSARAPATCAISSSNPMPAASAACGSRRRLGHARDRVGLQHPQLVAGGVEHQVDARDAAAAEQPCTSAAPAPARAPPRRRGSSAGHTNAVRADLVARLEVVEVLVVAGSPPRPAAAWPSRTRPRGRARRTCAPAAPSCRRRTRRPARRGRRRRPRATLMPSAEPWPAGLTTIGKPRRSSIAGSASAAPSSLKAVC